MKNADEVVLLFGAGAPQSLGVPAMGGMFDEFTRAAKSKSGDDWNVCELFVKVLGVPHDLEEFLLAANAAIEFPDRGLFKLVEKVVSPRAGEKLKEFKSRTRAEISKIKHTRNSVLDFMSNKCFQFDRDLAVEQLTGLVKVVAKKGYPIFTTNYDFSVEYVAEENKVDLNDNFQERNRRLLWDPNISFSKVPGLTLVKLHGSVTWYLDKSEQIEKLDTLTSINKAGNKVERLVVFPTRFKDIYEQSFFALYSKFLSALSNAKCLIVVGHSLRDEYLRAAIIERYRKADFKILVIHPKWPATLPENFSPAKRGASGGLTHVAQKFEDFSDELAHVLENTKPELVPKECVGIVRQIARKKDTLKIHGRIYQLKVGTMTIKLSVDAYVPKEDRPASFVAWLNPRAKNPDETLVNQISTPPLIISPKPISLGLTGSYKADTSININVPRYNEWLAGGEKVRLTVALVKDVTRLDISNIKGSQVIARDERELKYSA